jgi:peptide/nickel transport system permease protein
VGSRKYLLKKFLQALSTLLFVLAFNFVLFRMIGDPVKLLTRSNVHLTPQEQEELKAEFGLDKPIPLQFVDYMGDTVRLDFGRSMANGRPVWAVISERIWPTVLLVGVSTLLSTAFGLLIGIKGAWQRGSTFDTSTLFGSLVLYAMPEGWLGMILLITFAGAFTWFPPGGYESYTATAGGWSHIADVLNHLFLPCLTLTIGYIGEYIIIMRSSLLEVMGEDFVMTARAKGVRDRDVRRRHAVPNALLPTLTLVFYSFGFVIGGSILIEAVYSWPGLGLLEFEAIRGLDFTVLQALFLLISGAVILFNFAADILYSYLDPRVKEA